MFNIYKDVENWKRITELSEGPPSLWGSKGVLPDGVVQGYLGDCWFLAAAAALAEHPERIKGIFTNEDYSEAGIYQVTLYVRGQPVKIVVDDRIALRAGS